MKNKRSADKNERSIPGKKLKEPVRKSLDADRIEELERRVAALESLIHSLPSPVAALRTLHADTTLVEAAVEMRHLVFTLRQNGPTFVRIRVDGDSHLLEPGVPYRSLRSHAESESVPLLLEVAGTPNQVATIDVQHGKPAIISGAVAGATMTAIPHTIWVDW